MITNLEVRKGLGRFFLGMGLLHGSMVAFACLCRENKIRPFRAAFAIWLQFYLYFFAGLLIGAVLYTWSQCRQTEELALQPTIDCSLGVLLFFALSRPVDYFLLGGGPTPWLALLPGAFLAYYGLNLCRGRQIWSRLEFH